MITPKVYDKEKERLNNLKSYSILDTLPEEDYDNLTRIAASICGTPVSLITLIDSDRQWFKSSHGIGVKETDVNISFCGHLINDPEEVLMVPDSRLDIRFHDNPLVTGDTKVIFYAGVSLVSDEGYPLGSLCVIDNEPKKLNKDQLDSLKALSKQVINLLRLRKNEKKLKHTLAILEDKNLELERFAYIAAHDLKSPLNNISEMAKLFLKQYSIKLDDEGVEMMQMILNSSDKLKKLVHGLLEFSKSETILNESKVSINLKTLHKNLSTLFSFENDLNITLETKLTEIQANETVLDQILINLLTNAIKYNDKNLTRIEISITENKTHYNFDVIDNGPGIPPILHDKIFTIFKIGANQDKYGKQGNGIGLATVKKIVEKSGGDISVSSELGNGAKFSFSIKK
ncbi:GHKL domain-containing protein [Cellulophaga sp. HaHaR_3_176]|uniref:sensor histidine kinase n=1 Tax=Cellulophaga sp. HaHaR_3_176 TaxID=1942464 RepID=UPI001C1FB08A|nr:ATP-binding protein [Cellulophaga sp. HaHaR_3_176]QWX82673.1 GHKL domain-containing protein [Cellulophaga sp. HaHaR_3_176]